MPTTERRRAGRESHDDVHAAGDADLFTDAPDRIEVLIARPLPVDDLRRNKQPAETGLDAVFELARGLVEVAPVHERDRNDAPWHLVEEILLPSVVGTAIRRSEFQVIGREWKNSDS